MRRIDAIGISIGFLLSGGAIYLFLQYAGLDGLSAGVWSQLLLVTIVVVWTATYLTRVFSSNMTYNQQLKDYEDAVLQKRLDEMSPAEIEKLMAEVEAEKSKKSK